MREILAIIPARGGSRGLPGKNLRQLCGRPLLWYAIDVAKRAASVARIVVSTDDKKIASVAAQCGADVPFLRPRELAKDDTPGIEPVIHALNWLAEKEGYCPDLVLLLQPTSPLRVVDDVNQAVKLFYEKQADSIVSVCPAEHHPYWLKKVSATGVMKNFMSTKKAYYCRQELPIAYNINGAIYLSRPEIVITERTFYPRKTYVYVMPKERSVDIDDAFDFEFAEFLMRRGYNGLCP